ncbi:MAG: hypothetical protein JXM70_22695 [Pirellulales bacterium]|nr:hypothetical protein [Pirellulales bacterium]
MLSKSTIHFLRTLLGLVLCIVSVDVFAADSGAKSDDWRAAVKKLPAVPACEEGDWLVVPTKRRAGVFRGSDPRDLVIDNGLLRRTFRLEPNAASIGLLQLTANKSFLRAVRPECSVRIDGKDYPVGGLSGQPIGNYLSPQWLEKMKPLAGAFTFDGFEVKPISPRFKWKRRAEWLAEDPSWPPPGIHLILHFRPPANQKEVAGASIDVHYELYDGIPLLCKWFTLHNRGKEPLRLETFTSEILACTEVESVVEDLIKDPRLGDLHVETDFTSVADDGIGSQRDTVHWLTDPGYKTQVNFQLQTRCLLKCRPPLGPDRIVKPGETFESFLTWILAYDGTDALRRRLSLARMYRMIAPWSMENPSLFHIRHSDPKLVREGIDQAAAVGFDMVIMTFSSGFDVENDSPEYLATMKGLADYAHKKGVALGGYSLLASRKIGPEDDVINPKTGKPGGFARFENSPCLESRWSQEYFRKLRNFYEVTGFDVLEHDGSYPGDACASTNHPGHRGYKDSRWNQWETITGFYRWCRARGIYLNVPDWYFLNGSNKSALGYRETNWSLPRAFQEIIERQNIYDGISHKTTTMGWMFVPLSEYHGGGAAATIEPLCEHLDHYERRLANLFGTGVQACWRGPRLFDTPQTKVVVKRWVDFYKKHKRILDSDIILLRRADGCDWDGWMHIDPRHSQRGLAMLYNPLNKPIERVIKLPLYYTGLTDTAMISIDGAPAREMRLGRDYELPLSVKIPAKGHAWVLIEAPTANK